MSYFTQSLTKIGLKWISLKGSDKCFEFNFVLVSFVLIWHSTYLLEMRQLGKCSLSQLVGQKIIIIHFLFSIASKQINTQISTRSVLQSKSLLSLISVSHSWFTFVIYKSLIMRIKNY